MALARAQQDILYSPVPRATIQEHVLEKLRDLILNGGIEPGRTVTVQSLSEAFGVSAMPVREAMQRLVAEKALTIVSGRSVGIPLLTAERLEDLRRVRVEIEGTAIKWATQLISPEDLTHLESLIEEMELAKAEGDRTRYIPANRDFHFTIYRAAASDALLKIIELLWLQTGPYINFLTASNWDLSGVEHRSMHAALKRRDATAARRALQADIDTAASALARVLTVTKPQGRTSSRRAS